MHAAAVPQVLFTCLCLSRTSSMPLGVAELRHPRPTTTTTAAATTTTATYVSRPTGDLERSIRVSAQITDTAARPSHSCSSLLDIARSLEGRPTAHRARNSDPCQYGQECCRPNTTSIQHDMGVPAPHTRQKAVAGCALYDPIACDGDVGGEGNRVVNTANMFGMYASQSTC